MFGQEFSPLTFIIFAKSKKTDRDTEQATFFHKSVQFSKNKTRVIINRQEDEALELPSAS